MIEMDILTCTVIPKLDTTIMNPPSLPPICKGMKKRRLAKSDVNARIMSLFSLLDDRERRVMTLIYGIDTDRHTMAEVGMLMDIKRERVRQIRDKALRKLRKARQHFNDIS